MRTVHQSDPDRLPDDHFLPGAFGHLVPGNRGRQLDPRRTPVRVVSLDWRTGHFTVEIEAFEDRGAHWQIPFEKHGNFQFARDARLASSDEVERLAARAAELDKPLRIPLDPGRRAATLAEVERRAGVAGEWLTARSRFFAAHAAPDANAAHGPPELCADALAFLEERGAGVIERRFTAQYVSNPYSGECVKGHGIVLAELGLAPYEGRAPRDDALFGGEWSKDARAEHVLWRLAFVRAWTRRAEWREVLLHRGVSSDDLLREEDSETFLSLSFRFDVAWSCYAGATPKRFGHLVSRRVSADRLFMTHFETEAMNRQFLEAEAVVLGLFREAANG